MLSGQSSLKGLGIFTLLLLPGLAHAQTGLPADTLYGRGSEHFNHARYDRAQPLLERAYALYTPEADSSNWLNAGMYLGTVLQRRSYHDRGLRHFRELLERGGGLLTPYSLAYIHSSMGQTYNALAMPDSALRHFEAALLHAVDSEDSTMVGAVYNSIGSTHKATGAYRRSLEYRRRALEYYRQRNDSTYIATALNNIGLAYKDLGIYDHALSHLNRSLAIREKLGSAEDMGTIFHNIGLVQRELGHYDQALVAYRKALEYSRQTGQPASTALTLNNIGVLYAGMGDPQTALEYYRQALEIGEDRFSPEDLAFTYRNIGSRLWELDRHEEALSFYKRALVLRRQTGNPHTVASSYWDLARANVEQGDPKVASVYVEEGAFLADSTGHPELLADASYWRGRLLFEREAYGEALDQFRDAYDTSRALPYTQQLRPLIWISHTFNRLNSDSTLHYGRMAVELIERNRERIGAASQLRREYFRQYTGFYLSLAARTIEYGGSASEAYALVEASKARTLSDELREASLRIDERLPDSARVERRDRLDDLNDLYVQRESTTGQEALDSLNTRIREAELNFASYQNELSRTYSEYRSPELPEPVTLSRAQALSPPNSVILEYAVAEDRLLIFLISRSETLVRVVPLHEGKKGAGEVLGERVQQYRDAIDAQAPVAELETLSAGLFDPLIDPISRELGPYENLMVVPDGPLAYLPFEALRRSGRYLIEDHTIKYIPSVTSLQLLGPPPAENRQDLLAVAGSEFTASNSSAMPRGRALSTLPSTLVEVDSIAGYFDRTTILKEDQVHEQAVKNRLNNSSYRFIHLATHGLIDEDYPAMSGLALDWSGEMEAAGLEDGLLRSSEIYSLRLNTRMVVLSACNTGMGPMVSGEGILGLQRSFFYAGAPTVVVSLWSVYDRSSSYMMQKFYRALLDHPGEETSWWDRFSRWAGWNDSIPYGTAARAMRQAKLEMIGHPLFSHPVHWAPFIPVGR